MMTSTRSFGGKNMEAMMARADDNRAQTCKGTTTTTDNSGANKGARRSASTTTKGHEANRIEHNYHDYAAVTEVPMQVAPRTEPKASGGVSNPFPVVLHKLLSQADQMGFSDVISWQPHGRSFLIHQPKEFVRDIVPRYFKHSKLSSFQRQLSLYGFMRLCQESADKGSYFHELFLRGRFSLCAKIQRTRVKGTWVRSSASPETEPDFYAMDHVVDLEESSTQSVIPVQNLSTASSEVRKNYVSPRSSPSMTSRDHGQNVLALDLNADRNAMENISNLQPASDFLDAHMKQEGSSDFISNLPLLPPMVEVSKLCEFDTESDMACLDPLNFQRKRREHDNVHSLLFLGRHTSSYPQLMPESSFSELGAFLLDVDLGAELDFADEMLRSARV